MKPRLLGASLALLLILLTGEARAESSVWAFACRTSTLCLSGSYHILRASAYLLPLEFEAAYRQFSSQT